MLPASYNKICLCICNFYSATAPSRPGAPHYGGFTITFRHFTLGRIPLDEWSAPRRHLYLTTHTTHNRQTSMPTGGIRIRKPSKRAAGDPRLGIGMTVKAKKVKKNSEWVKIMPLVHTLQLYLSLGNYRAMTARRVRRGSFLPRHKEVTGHATSAQLRIFYSSWANLSLQNYVVRLFGSWWIQKSSPSPPLPTPPDKNNCPFIKQTLVPTPSTYVTISSLPVFILTSAPIFPHVLQFSFARKFRRDH
jgi:hypothetical protein